MTYTRRDAKAFSTPLNSLRRMCFKAAMYAAVVGFAGLGSMSAQFGANPESAPAVDPMVQRNISDWAIQSKGVADDWTHHYLVFSNPGTEADAIRKGNYERWLKVANDPRFTLQQIKRSGGVKALAAGSVSAAGATAASTASASASAAVAVGRGPGLPGPQTNSKYAIKKDWNIAIGSVAGSTTGTVSSNTATGTSTVTINGTSVTGSAPTAAAATGTVSSNGATGTSTVTINGTTLTASAPTAATGSGTVTSNGATGSSTVTLDGVTLTASGPSAATGVGTISSNGATGSSTVAINGVTLTASAPTVATGTGTITSNNATTGSTVTIDGQTLTASAPVAASQTGTFTGAPGASQTASITFGANVLSLATNATTESSIGTVSAVPTSASAPTLTITNNAIATPNVLTLTANATGTTVTGTFSSTGSVAGNTFTIKNSLNANTLTLTAAAAATGTVTFVGDPSGSDTMVIGSVTYVWHGSSSGCGATANCIIHGGNTTQDAQNLEAAINNNPAQCGFDSGASCLYNFTAANPNVTATEATNVVTVTNITAGTVSWSDSSGTGVMTLNPTATIAAPGTNGCTSATTGKFNLNPTLATEASNFAAAINACNTTYSAVGATASSAAGVATITATTVGATPTFTLGGTFSNFVWGTPVLGSNGTGACTSSTTGTFATGATTAIVASNIAAAINSASCQTTFPVGVTASYTSGSTFTVTNPVPGPYLAVGGSNLGALFSWGALTGGSSGTNTCASTTSGTFATSTSGTTMATNLATAIAACPVGAGVTASSAGAVVTVTARSAGTGGNSIALAETLNNFGWTTANLANGSDGAASGTNFPWWSVNAAASATQLATNITAAINLNSNLQVVLTGVSATSSTNVITVTARSAGTMANTYGTADSFSGLTWGHTTLTGGLDGTASATTFPYWSGNAAVSTTQLATNIAATITANTTLNTLVSATGSGAVVNVTALATGTGGNSITTTSSLTGFAWGGGTLSGGGCGATAATTFAYDSGTTSCTAVSATQLASNIVSAINANTTLENATTGVTAASTGGGITLTANAPGTSGNAIATTASLPGFTWTAGLLSGGANGTASSTTFPYWSGNTAVSTTQLATNIAAAINANSTLSAAFTTTSAGAVVTVTDKTAGTGGNSIATTASLPGFTWGGATMSGGTDGTTGPTSFAYWSVNAPVSTTQLATNIAAAINANSTLSPLVTATSSGNVVTVTADTTGTGGNYTTASANWGTPTPGFAWAGNPMTGGASGARVQPNMFPAKFSFSTTTESCTDFVAYPTGTAGATGAATIVAFNNLYAGTGACIAAGASPPPYWAYNTGGMATTSPVLSQDGTQVAYIQVSGTTASLVLVKWAAGGTPTLPVTLTSQANGAAYRSCTAPCMYAMAFGNGFNDTFSAPFYSYDYDNIFVGDDNGKLHEFTGVFGGSPAEAGSPWPVSLGSAKLSIPVYDKTSGLVIVGDFAGALHSVNATTGAVNATLTGVGTEIADAPLVDGSAEILFPFTTSSGAYSYTGYNAVYEMPVTFPGGTLPIAGFYPGVAALSTTGSNAGHSLYAGTFDNVYYQSTGAPSGNIYVVGDTGVEGSGILYQVRIVGGGITTNGNFALVTALSSNTGGGSTSYPWPSPMTEFCNTSTGACNASGGVTTGGGKDYIFFSVNRGSKTGCTATVGNGCILAYNVTSETSTLPAAPATPAEVGSGLNVATPITNGCWATSGLVVDNGLATTGNSQVYFIGLGGNAAGGPTGTTQTNAACTAGTAGTIGATQASQVSP